MTGLSRRAAAAGARRPAAHGCCPASLAGRVVEGCAGGGRARDRLRALGSSRGRPDWPSCRWTPVSVIVRSAHPPGGRGGAAHVGVGVSRRGCVPGRSLRACQGSAASFPTHSNPRSSPLLIARKSSTPDLGGRNGTGVLAEMLRSIYGSRGVDHRPRGGSARPGPPRASEVVEVRSGDRPTFTRVVFELDAPAGYRIEASHRPRRAPDRHAGGVLDAPQCRVAQRHRGARRDEGRARRWPSITSRSPRA